MRRLLAVLFTLCCVTTFVGVRGVDILWRYTNLQQHGGKISTRDVLKLEAVTNWSNLTEENYIWTAETCNLTESQGMVSHLKCTSEGTHNIDLKIVGVGNKTRQLKFHTTFHCYDWYLRIERSPVEENSTTSRLAESVKTQFDIPERRVEDHQTLKVWILDYIHASSAERRNHAILPSKNSRLLTQEYYILGQQPRIQMVSRIGTGRIDLPANFSHYNQTEGLWVFHITILVDVKRQPTYTIQGRSVALYNCFVRPRVVPLSATKYPRLGETNATYYVVGDHTMSLALLPDPCQGNIAAVIVSGKLYMTQDDFVSLTPLPAPPGSTADLDIIGITLMYNFIVILSAKHEVYYLGRNESQFRLYQGPADFEPIYISSADWCVDGLYINIDLDLLTMSDGQEVWVSNSFGPAENLTLPIEKLEELAFGAALSYEIHDVSLDIQPGRLGVAIKLTINSESKVVFAIHDMILNTWSLAPFWVDFKQISSGRITFYFIGLAKPSFYFRNQKSLFYSYDDGENFGIKRVFGCTHVSSLDANGGDYIRDIIVSRSGDISILLNTNQIIYGKVKRRELVPFEMGSFYPPGDLNTIHWFDNVNRLWFITVHEDGSVERLLYPVQDELMSAIGEDEVCPYRQFTHNTQNQVYLLDKQDTWSIWVYLVFRDSKRNHLDIIFSDVHNVIEYTTHVQKEYISGITSNNLTVTFSHKHDADMTTARDRDTGVAILESRPHRTNLLCNPPYSAVAYMSVGCPDGRHIRVSSANSLECANSSHLYPKIYTIPAEFWKNLTTGHIAGSDLEVKLDASELGCPIIVDSTRLFKPKLELYDHDKFVQVMEEDYIIWEINGRIDYLFTHSVQEMGCQRPPQSWDRLREEANYSIPADELWGPRNYKSCYVAEADGHFTGKLHLMNYEILNHSSPNQLLLSIEYDALHIFRVKVVSPDYSFCNLSATFAVKIKGVIPPSDLRDIAAANYTVLTCIILALLGTYVWFHKKTVRKQNPAGSNLEGNSKTEKFHRTSQDSHDKSD